MSNYSETKNPLQREYLRDIMNTAKPECIYSISWLWTYNIAGHNVAWLYLVAWDSVRSSTLADLPASSTFSLFSIGLHSRPASLVLIYSHVFFFCQLRSISLSLQIILTPLPNSHILHALLPPVKISQYFLRPRHYNRIIPVANNHQRWHFIMRMLYLYFVCF